MALLLFQLIVHQLRLLYTFWYAIKFVHQLNEAIAASEVVSDLFCFDEAKDKFDQDSLFKETQLEDDHFVSICVFLM